MATVIIFILIAIVFFATGVAVGTKYGFQSGMLFIIDRHQEVFVAQARLYKTMLDLGDGGALILTLVQKEEHEKVNG